MFRSIEKLKETKKEKDHAFSAVCCVIPRSTLCTAMTNNSFSKIARDSLTFIIFTSFMMMDKELMDHFFTRQSKARKLKTLALYFHDLQLNGKASLGFSHTTKEDYDYFK